MSVLPPKITTEDKLKEVERELRQRDRVYPRLIRSGKLKPDTAARQIRVMRAVADDYRDKVKEGPLFAAARGEG